ncbi:hypothetical protein D061_12796, partial [Streptococcus pneumoniae 1488]
FQSIIFIEFFVARFVKLLKIIFFRKQKPIPIE